MVFSSSQSALSYLQQVAETRSNTRGDTCAVTCTTTLTNHRGTREDISKIHHGLGESRQGRQ